MEELIDAALDLYRGLDTVFGFIWSQLCGVLTLAPSDIFPLSTTASEASTSILPFRVSGAGNNDLPQKI